MLPQDSHEETPIGPEASETARSHDNVLQTVQSMFNTLQVSLNALTETTDAYQKDFQQLRTDVNARLSVPADSASTASADTVPTPPSSVASSVQPASTTPPSLPLAGSPGPPPSDNRSRFLEYITCSDTYSPPAKVDQLFVNEIFPWLTLRSTALREPVDMRQDLPESIPGMPTFSDKADADLHLKITEAQTALRKMFVPFDLWAAYTVVYLKDDFESVATQITQETEWHEVVFNILRIKGLATYCCEREAALKPPESPGDIFEAWTSLVSAYDYAPVILTDGFARAGNLILAVSRWDKSMGKRLLARLQTRVPSCRMRDPAEYVAVLEDLYAFATHEWKLHVSTLTALGFERVV